MGINTVKHWWQTTLGSTDGKQYGEEVMGSTKQLRNLDDTQSTGKPYWETIMGSYSKTSSLTDLSCARFVYGGHRSNEVLRNLSWEKKICAWEP